VAVPEDLAVHRVTRRVQAGGHPVPEEKIRARHQRLWTHVSAMVPLADVVELYDNSGDRPRTVASLIGGEPVGPARWPDWTPDVLVRLTE
jgi:predicted ABC-type ATPase